MSKVFLSHSSHDKSLVRGYAQILKSYDVDCWLDELEIRPGDSLVTKIFEEGIDKSDYILCFLTKNSSASRWVREELENAYVKAVGGDGPKIIPMVFDGATIPSFLRHTVQINVRDGEEDRAKAVFHILRGLHLDSKIEERPSNIGQLEVNAAFQHYNQLILFASRPNPLEWHVFSDHSSVKFHDRETFLLLFARQTHNNKWVSICSEHICTKRIAKTALGVHENEILLFMNAKAKDNTYDMDGILYKLWLSDNSFRLHWVDTVFQDKNWGWSSYFDEDGNINHASSEDGNHHIRGTELLEERAWDTIVRTAHDKYLAETCPFERRPDGQEVGYRFSFQIDLDDFLPELSNWVR